MRLLDFLVSSRTRRQVLRTLWAHSEGRAPVGLTVYQLAKLSRVTYSGAHREVNLMKRVRLIETQRVGKAILCRWSPESSAGAVLDALLDGHGSSDRATRPSEDQVVWNLRRWNAPLVDPGSPGSNLTLDETLAYAVELSRRRPEVARVWPVVLAKNRSAVNLKALTAASRRLGQKRALGFLLMLSARLLHDQDLSEFASGLRDNRWRAVRNYFLGKRGRRAQALAEQRTPPLARDWLFRMNMPMDSFETFFHKHYEPDEAV